MATEKRIENQIKKYLTDIGAYWVKNHGSVASRAGVLDLTVCYRGKYYSIEVKAPDEEPTELQKYNIRKIREAGGVAIVADNLQTVKDLFEKRGKNEQ